MVSAGTRWWLVFSFDTDEGINLMKAVLVAKGFSLFSEIWTDQPPLLTFILAATETLFPRDISVARVLILAFSGLLLWSLFRIVYRLEGRASAWLATAALLAIFEYQIMSVSVKIGLPAVALATAAIDQTLAGADDNKIWRYWIAGILFSLSLQTKMFTAILFPTLVFTVFVQPESGRLGPLRLCSFRATQVVLSALISFFLIAAISGEEIFSQLVIPHYNSVVAQGGIWVLIYLLRKSIPLALALFLLAGLLVCLMRMKVSHVIPTIWLVSAGLVLALHRPLWDHHLLLLYVPIAWISALSIQLVSWPSRRSVICMGSIILLLTTGIWANYNFRLSVGPLPVRSATSPEGEWIFPALLRRAPAEGWTITDNLLDAYFADRLVPPELVVWSLKRMMGKYLTPEDLISIIQKRKPDQILLRRFDHARIFLDYLELDYECIPVSQQAPVRAFYYVRKGPLR